MNVQEILSKLLDMGIGRETLAARAGVSSRQLTRIKNGSRTTPRTEARIRDLGFVYDLTDLPEDTGLDLAA